MSSTITSFQCKCCISSIAHETFIGLDYMSYTSSVLKETRTAYPSRAPWFPPDVWWVRVAKLFSCMCCGIILWIYSWKLFPNAWINHNLNFFRWVDLFFFNMSITFLQIYFLLHYKFCKNYSEINTISCFNNKKIIKKRI